jgi:uncharacterized membrane protein
MKIIKFLFKLPYYIALAFFYPFLLLMYSYKYERKLKRLYGEQEFFKQIINDLFSYYLIFIIIALILLFCK